MYTRPVSLALLALAVQAVGARERSGPPKASAAIAIDYPADGSVFPPEIVAPTFLWRDADSHAVLWRIEFTFADHAPAIKVMSRGGPMPIGEIDKRCAEAGAVPPTLTPLESQAQSWKPDPETWAAIKAHSVKRPATVTITGFRDAAATQAASRGSIRLQTSKDPVAAGIFYRDVPLVPPPVGERGIIMPLPTSAVPLIAWRLLYIGEPKSRLMMQGLPTCANCHSFSRDGKTMGLDVDGPANDKGLYGIVHVEKHTSIRDKDVIRWSSFAEERASKRFGFMSQISPDGQYVVTSVEPPGSHMRNFDQRLYNGFYSNYGFGQVFYPTRGILAWYSKKTGKLQPLPGADDPNYVQTSAFWSADGKWLVFSRAKAIPPYHEGQQEAKYANDPNETQIQYDLYRIPFNEGRGGKAEPVKGASANGMSNNFPKISPDGKWIVWVENKNGLLMRPDSQLWIVPFKGGKARKLRSNTDRMNSWHSFSPNGRWLVFASKGRSLYTQLYLTHIDKSGNDSPRIRIENATAANRAVNIPEFVNIAPGELESMDAPATEFYRLADMASGMERKGDHAAAIAAWRKAIALDPEDSKSRFNLGLSLQETGRLEDSIAQYKKAIEINPNNAPAYTNLGVALAAAGKLDEAIDLYRKSLAIEPRNAKAESNLGAALIQKGQTAEAIEHCTRAVEIDPEYADAHNSLGISLARVGRLDEGLAHLEKAVALSPSSLEYQYNLGRVLAARGRFADAVPHFEQAVKLSNGQEPLSLDMLAAMYSETGRYKEAVEVGRRALDVALSEHNYMLADALKARLARYEKLAQ